MNKIRLFIALTIIFLIFIGVVFYLASREKPKPPSQVSPAPILHKISSIEALPLKILYPELSDGEIYYQGYYQGQLLKADLASGKITVLEEAENLPELEDLILSPNTTKILPLGSKEDITSRYFLFNLEEKTIIPLDLAIKSATFISDEKIVYHYLDQEKNINGLFISDPDGKNYKKIINLEDETVFLNTLGTGEIVYTNKEETDNFNVLKIDGTGKRKISLPILVNINKIAWSSDGKSLFAALREEGKDTDTFYKINIETGEKQEIKYQSETPIDAQNLMLTKDNKILYFTEEDFLYKMDLESK